MSVHLPPGVNPNDIPAGTPPPGQHSNLIDPPKLQSTNLGVNILLMVIGVTLASLSLFDHRRRLQIPDYTLAAGVIFAVGYSALIFSFSEKETHQWDISLGTVIEPIYTQQNFAAAFLVTPVFFLAKSAILALYFQVFNVGRKLRLWLYAGLILDLVTYLPNWILTPILCAPKPGQPWGIEVGLKCSRQVIWGIVQSAISVFLDIYLFVLPIPIVMGLQMSQSKKNAVLAVFGTAFFGILASIISLVYRSKLLHATDTTWYSSIVELCNLIEIWVAIIVASMPGSASRFKVIAIESGRWNYLRSRIISVFTSNQSNATGSSGAMRASGGESYSRLNETHNMELRDQHRNGDLDTMNPPQRRIAKVIDIEQSEQRIDGA